MFIKVSLAHGQWFRKYCGMSGEGESLFLKLLQKLRGAKLLTKMKEHVESNDGAWAEARKNKGLILDQIPKVIEINVPEVRYGEEVNGGFEMRVLGVARSNELLAVELLATNLKFLRHGVLAEQIADIVVEESPPKRSKVHCSVGNRVHVPECPNVFWNSQRGCWYIKYKDADGFVHHKSYHPTKSDIDEKYHENCVDAARIAQTAYDSLTSGADHAEEDE